MYEIESGIELPRVRVKHEYPYELMQVGESFYVPDGNMNLLCNYNRVKGRRLGRVYVCRKEGEGIRVWRLS